MHWVGFKLDYKTNLDWILKVESNQIRNREEHENADADGGSHMI